MLLGVVTTLPDPDSEVFVANLERASLDSFTPPTDGGAATFRTWIIRRK